MAARPESDPDYLARVTWARACAIEAARALMALRAAYPALDTLRFAADLADILDDATASRDP